MSTPLVACAECARAVAIGSWGAIARHPGPAGAPVCLLCGDGEATLGADEWFALAGSLPRGRSWREDGARGLGLTPPAAGGRP